MSLNDGENSVTILNGLNNNNNDNLMNNNIDDNSNSSNIEDNNNSDSNSNIDNNNNQNNNNNNNNNNINNNNNNKLINSIKGRNNSLHRSLSNSFDDSYQLKHQKQLNSSNSKFTLNKNYLDSLEYSSTENIDSLESSIKTISSETFNNNNIATPPLNSKEQLLKELNNNNNRLSPLKDYISTASEDEATELVVRTISSKNLKLQRKMSTVSCSSMSSSISFCQMENEDNINKLDNSKNISLSIPHVNNNNSDSNKEVLEKPTIFINNQLDISSSSTSPSNSDNESPLSASQQKKNNGSNSNNMMIKIRDKTIDKTTPVNFNVGGTLFATSLRTIILYPNSLLYKIVEMQIDLVLKDEVIFIDRSPSYFNQVLDYIRTGEYIPSPNINSKGMLQEAEFYKLSELANLIRNEPELTRTDIITIINGCYDYPRLRGMWLTKINFSGLDLTCASFEYSNLAGCLFNSSLVPKASFIGCKLEMSSFKYCKADGTNFSKSILTNAVFSNVNGYEIIATGTDFSNSKLTNSILSCSDFSGSNFKGCLLNGVDFTNCNLSDCDFRGCSIDESTNFSGSLIKNTLFDQDSLSIAKNKKTWKKPKSVTSKNKIVIPHL